MSAHTPGPWAFHARLSGSENHKGFYIKSRKFVLAYDVIPVDSDGAEGQANARLIAAAPDLLDIAVRARRLLLEICEDASFPIPQTWVDAADAAIVKATGADA